MTRTRWGLEMRAIGGNPEASLRLGMPVARTMIVAMMLAGGIAGLAGMAEVSAIQGRLVASLSPGYGFTGFLVAWLAGGEPDRHRRHGVPVRGRQLRRRHPADHPVDALRGHQSPDGAGAVHRARTARSVAERRMSTSFAAAVLSSSIVSGTSLYYAALGRTGRRTRRHRQSRPRGADADRRGGRFRRRPRCPATPISGVVAGRARLSCSPISFSAIS